MKKETDLVKDEHAELNVLIKMFRSRDAELIKDKLNPAFKVVDEKTYEPRQVDIYITDQQNWAQTQTEVRHIRSEQAPLTIPVLMLVGKNFAQQLSRESLQIVDEIVEVPIKAEVLDIRMQNLKRQRLDSLQLSRQKDQLYQYRKAMDAANSGIILTDNRKEDNPIVYVNREFTKITGYFREEVIGRNCRFLQGEDRDQQEILIAEKAIQKGEPCRVTLRNYTREGKLFWNNLKIAPVKNNKGKVTHFIGIQNDITDQVEIRREIEEREQQWATLVQQDPDVILISTGEKGKIQFINPAGVEIYGVDDPSYLIGKNILDLTKGSPDYNEIEKDMRNALKGEDIPPKLTTIERVDGEIRYVELRKTPIQYKNEQAVLTVGRDVTEKHKAEQKLKSEYHKFSQLFQNEPSAIAVFDTSGIIISVNPAFERTFGYDEEEVIDENIDDLLTKTDEERKYAEHLTNNYVSGIHQKEAVRYDKQGNPIPVLMGGAPVREEGEVKYIFGIYTDIREQKRLEEENRKLLEQERTLRAKAEESRAKFKEIMHTTPSAICLLEGPEHRFTYVNKSYRHLFRKPHFIGRTVEEVFPEIVEQGFTEVLDKIYKTGEPFYGEEQSIQVWDTINEEWYELEMDFVYKPMVDDEGDTYGIFVDVIDVTDKVRYREELEEKLDEKRTLLEEIHHRVKNNMAVITGLLYMQMEESEEQIVRRPLKDALSRIQSMALVHEQLYQQSETGTAIELDRYLPRLAESVESYHVTDDVPIQVKVNADDVALALPRAVPVGLMTAELLANAYKHAFRERDEGTIEVTLKETEDDITLTVADDGVGLPGDFSMESRTLGMQIIQNLSSQIDGKLSFDSQQGEGTCFKITFPKTK